MTPDTLAALYARGADQKAALLKQAGGSLSVNQVAQRLGISWQAVDQQRRAGQLIAVLCGTDEVYPACQFAGNQVVSGLTEVLGQIGPGNTWAALAFLITPDESLGDLSPLDALQCKDERLKSLTLRLARATVGDGFG